ncbi:unnamed protein product [Amoebophrya sp. A120]|nr:unnamed protein product [Amoebophrya sp. A120]|eukprot:GSA120T00020870001.1
MTSTTSALCALHRGLRMGSSSASGSRALYSFHPAGGPTPTSVLTVAGVDTDFRARNEPVCRRTNRQHLLFSTVAAPRHGPRTGDFATVPATSGSFVTRPAESSSTALVPSSRNSYFPVATRITRTFHRSFSSAAAATATAADITILPNGVAQLRKLLKKEPDRYLRLTVNSGGCSGYQYEFKMDKTRKPDDIVVEQDGVTLLVDELSLDFLGSCEIDYTQEMIRASFQVVKNSSAEAGCGCGASFSVSSGF